MKLNEKLKSKKQNANPRNEKLKQKVRLSKGRRR